MSSLVGRKRKRASDAGGATSTNKKRRATATGSLLKKRGREAEKDRKSKRPKTTLSQSDTPDSSFDELAQGSEVIGVDEFERLAMQMGVDSSDLVVIAFAWQCTPTGAFCHLSRAEFVRGMNALQCSTLDDLRGKVAFLRGLLRSNHSFRDFYDFVFEWAKGKDLKLLDKNMALQMWPLLLSDRSKFVAEWVQYLESQKTRGISKDCWMQTLEFMHLMKSDGDIAAYDFDAFWPSLIDEFVAHYQAEKGIASTRGDDNGDMTC